MYKVYLVNVPLVDIYSAEGGTKRGHIAATCIENRLANCLINATASKVCKKKSDVDGVNTL